MRLQHNDTTEYSKAEKSGRTCRKTLDNAHRQKQSPATPRPLLNDPGDQVSNQTDHARLVSPMTPIWVTSIEANDDRIGVQSICLALCSSLRMRDRMRRAHN